MWHREFGVEEAQLRDKLSDFILTIMRLTAEVTFRMPSSCFPSAIRKDGLDRGVGPPLRGVVEEATFIIAMGH